MYFYIARDSFFHLSNETTKSGELWSSGWLSQNAIYFSCSTVEMNPELELMKN